jgi:hypothetical protein
LFRTHEDDQQKEMSARTQLGRPWCCINEQAPSSDRRKKPKLSFWTRTDENNGQGFLGTAETVFCHALEARSHGWKKATIVPSFPQEAGVDENQLLKNGEAGVKQAASSLFSHDRTGRRVS